MRGFGHLINIECLQVPGRRRAVDRFKDLLQNSVRDRLVCKGTNGMSL